MMKKPTPETKTAIVIVIFIMSWLLFPIVTFGEETILHLIPLTLLITQIVTSKLFRIKKLPLLSFFSPVVILPLIYTIIPTANYLRGAPTIMHCTYYIAKAPKFDPEKSVFLEYYDDDCDWSGMYYYTINVNNFVTNGLISVFGNPLKKNSVDNSQTGQ